MTIEIKRGYYKNGQLSSEIPLNHKNQIHGIERWWYTTGQLEYEKTYHEDQQHGIERWWYREGQLEYKAPYYEGRLHGIKEEWWIDGQLASKEYYVHGYQVTEEEYQAQNTKANEVVCSCGKKADVGCPCWWCGGKN